MPRPWRKARFTVKQPDGSRLIGTGEQPAGESKKDNLARGDVSVGKTAGDVRGMGSLVGILVVAIGKVEFTVIVLAELEGIRVSVVAMRHFQCRLKFMRFGKFRLGL